MDAGRCPPRLQRVGDFSQTVVSGTNGVPTPVGIFDPNSVTQTSATVYTRAALSRTRSFPIPDPYALKIMSIYPLPNRTPTDAFGANNFFTPGRPHVSRDPAITAGWTIATAGIPSTPAAAFPSAASTPPVPCHRSQYAVVQSAHRRTDSGGTPARAHDLRRQSLRATRRYRDSQPHRGAGPARRRQPDSQQLSSDTRRRHFTAADYDVSTAFPRSVQAVMPDFGAAPTLPSPGYFPARLGPVQQQARTANQQLGSTAASPRCTASGR